MNEMIPEQLLITGTRGSSLNRTLFNSRRFISMNMARFIAFSAIKSSVGMKCISRLNVSCSSLDTLFLHCHNCRLFDQILCQVISTELFKDVYAASRILKFSTESSFIQVDYSRKIFLNIDNSNGFIWNTMFRALIRESRSTEYISLYRLMFRDNFSCIDNYTYPILLQGCSLRLSYFEGTELHDHVVKTGFEDDVYIVNNLINMYNVCGFITCARKVFDESLVLDYVSWNSMLAGYVLGGHVKEAKWFYSQMPSKNVIASNSMIVLLGKFGNMDEAYQLFSELKEKDLVSWTTMISGYEQNEMYESSLNIFLSMYNYGIKVDEVVIIAVLSACSHLLSFYTGILVHCLVIKVGLEFYLNLYNALIYMYSTCGDVLAAEKLFINCSYLDLITWNSMVSGYIKGGLIKKAQDLFNVMPEKDIVSWGSMIAGYCQYGMFLETLELFQDMQLQGIQPDETIFVSVVSACAELSALDQGKWIDTYIRKNKVKMNPILGSTLINMYMKCGNVENGMKVFLDMEEKGVSSWNALILGLAMNGQVERSLNMFEQMKKYSCVPNEITFVAVLGACRHNGLVEEGLKYFNSMNAYNIKPNIKHYGCVVDLLGRRGLLIDAEELIETMPMAPDEMTLGALLGACKQHGNKEIGERIGRKVIQLQPEHDGFHVLLSNIYASNGQWGDVREIRGIMMRQGVVKTPGCSIIEVNGIVHEFLCGGKCHPQIQEIEMILHETNWCMKDFPVTDENPNS